MIFDSGFSQDRFQSYNCPGFSGQGVFVLGKISCDIRGLIRRDRETNRDAEYQHLYASVGEYEIQLCL